MSQKFENIKLGLDETLEEKLALLVPDGGDFRILRHSIDARKRSQVHQVYSVEVFGKDEVIPEENYALERVSFSGPRPIIVGSGPAGLFAAVRLVERGIPCILLERGSNSVDRLKYINRFWRYAELNQDNNVCFGEGGAGLYSDGKLITRIKSPHIPYVLHRLVQFGAPPEIQYLANPHVGSDRIRRIIPKIREYLTSKGCEIHFDTRMKELITQNNSVVGVRCEDGKEFYSDHVVLAIGHSARDTFQSLRESGVFMEGKSFAVGLRIEHPQKMVNQIQYRESSAHPILGSANYKLTHYSEDDKVGVYSFCMCPGGYILSSGTDANGIVCNGMSNYHRNSPFANAAIVVSIDYNHHFSGQDLFAGFDFQSQMEQAAKKSVETRGGKKEIPAQLTTDFMNGKLGPVIATSSPSGVVPARLDEIMPKFIVDKLRDGLTEFDKKMDGFIGPTGQLHGVETRTSCPVRITRDPQTLQSLSHQGLYPVGEGAGYAGGITSAAVDGIRAAEAIVASVLSVTQKLN